ncbi:MAG: hypothetical protein Q7T01_00340 [bacterium]|nr:hypothetical protein [bacterium]
MPHRTAIIITGNPALITNNSRAEILYAELAALLEALGFTVTLDAGAPQTVPPAADCWVGHSRGADRLQFAPPDTIVIGIGVPQVVGGNPFPVVNHPQDAMAQRTYHAGSVVAGADAADDTYHYVLTKDMKRAITEIVKRGRS